jgi:hypothetical protein
MFDVSTVLYAVSCTFFRASEELMGKMSWAQRWFRRAAIPASGHSSAEAAASDESDVPSGRLVPGGFRRPPVDPAGQLVRRGKARPSADPAGRLVPGGFRRPPVDPAGRLVSGSLARPPAGTIQSPRPTRMHTPRTSTEPPFHDSGQSSRSGPAQQSSTAAASQGSARDDLAESQPEVPDKRGPLIGAEPESDISRT